MIERFTELHTTINEILIHHTTAPAMVSALEIVQLKEIMNILRPLEIATKEVSGEKYVTASTVIPMVHCLIDKISSIKTDDAVASLLKNAILNECQKRFGKIENVYLLAVSTLLDPKFKKMHFKDRLACAKSIQHIKSLMEKEFNTKEKSPMVSEPSISSDKKMYSIWSLHYTMMQRSQNIINSDDTLQDEVSLYLKTSVCEFSKNPLQIWEQLASTCPLLSKLARKFLSLVASSVPSERLFSKAGQTLTQQRNRLKGKKLSKLLFVQSLDKKSWDLG